MWTIAALAAASLLPSPALALGSGASLAAAAEEGVARKALRTAGLVEPMHFKQRLLICNAYPSDAPAAVMRNGKEVLPGEKTSIGYQQCTYVPVQLQTHDRLEFGLRDFEVEGSFEVGQLPATDAVLLLVLEKHASSSMISFQSFAFPKSTDRREAQLAVINAFTGGVSAPHLKMEDHVSGKEIKMVAKRIEQLNFNRVYSVEAGEYDASIADSEHKDGPSAGRELERKTKRVVKMEKSANYVVLRTGGGDFEESLVVFPPPTPDAPHSGAAQKAATFSLLASLIFATLAAW